MTQQQSNALEQVIAEGLVLISKGAEATSDGRLTFWEILGLIGSTTDFVTASADVVEALPLFRAMDKGSRRILIAKALERDHIYQTLGLSLGIGDSEQDFQILEDLAMNVLSIVQNAIDAAENLRNLR